MYKFVGNIYTELKASAWLVYDEGKQGDHLEELFPFEGISHLWRGGVWQPV